MSDLWLADLTAEQYLAVDRAIAEAIAAYRAELRATIAAWRDPGDTPGRRWRAFVGVAVIVLIGAVLADTLTYLALPTSAEQNPLVIAGGPLAVLVRWSGVALLAAVVRHLRPWQRVPLLAAAGASGLVGAIANVRALG